MLESYDNFYIKHGNNLAKKWEHIEWITPNGISYFRLLGCIPMFYCFSQGGIYYLIGAILNEILYLLDRTDGALARVRGTSSQYGHWIEVLGDRLIAGQAGLFGLFLALGIWKETQNVLVWILLFWNVFAKYADRAILSMNTEDKSPDGVMVKLQVDNEGFKKKKLYKIASTFDTWSYEIIIIFAFLYYPLKPFLTIHPVLLGFFISTVLVQANWIGRTYVSIKFFKKNNWF